jgi:8-oxo-dGTP pyrophosphatase MutT (NUDIX family)
MLPLHDTSEPPEGSVATRPAYGHNHPMTEDPRLQALRTALARRLAGPGPPEPGLSEAAVLLALRTTDPLELLLIQRAEKEGDPWSGHMALPGGRREPTDSGLLATALRETQEETAIRVPPRTCSARWRRFGPRTVAASPSSSRRSWRAVPPGTRAVPSPAEVETALWVPLPHLASESAVDEILIELEEGSTAFPALSYQDYVIWGLTHRIITDFMDVAKGGRVV